MFSGIDQNMYNYNFYKLFVRLHKDKRPALLSVYILIINWASSFIWDDIELDFI